MCVTIMVTINVVIRATATEPRESRALVSRATRVVVREITLIVS